MCRIVEDWCFVGPSWCCVCVSQRVQLTRNRSLELVPCKSQLVLRTQQHVEMSLRPLRFCRVCRSGSAIHSGRELAHCHNSHGAGTSGASGTSCGGGGGGGGCFLLTQMHKAKQLLPRNTVRNRTTVQGSIHVPTVMTRVEVWFPLSSMRAHLIPQANAPRCMMTVMIEVAQLFNRQPRNATCLNATVADHRKTNLARPRPRYNTPRSVSFSPEWHPRETQGIPSPSDCRPYWCTALAPQ